MRENHKQNGGGNQGKPEGNGTLENCLQFNFCNSGSYNANYANRRGEEADKYHKDRDDSVPYSIKTGFYDKRIEEAGEYDQGGHGIHNKTRNKIGKEDGS